MNRNTVEIKRQLWQWKDKPARKISDGMKGAIIGHMNKACGNSLNRRIILNYLFGDNKVRIAELSSSKLLDWQWNAIYDWIAMRNDETGWHVDEQFVTDCHVLVNSIIPRLPFM